MQFPIFTQDECFRNCVRSLTVHHIQSDIVSLNRCPSDVMKSYHIMEHGDITIWSIFHITGYQSPHKGLVMRGLYMFFVSLNSLMNKVSSSRGFDATTPTWCRCDMIYFKTACIFGFGHFTKNIPITDAPVRRSVSTVFDVYFIFHRARCVQYRIILYSGISLFDYTKFYQNSIPIPCKWCMAKSNSH